MNCPECGRLMQNLGNVSGYVFLTSPTQWEEIHVCHSCRVKKTVMARGSQLANYEYLTNYKEVEG